MAQRLSDGGGGGVKRTAADIRRQGTRSTATRTPSYPKQVAQKAAPAKAPQPFKSPATKAANPSAFGMGTSHIRAALTPMKSPINKGGR